MGCLARLGCLLLIVAGGIAAWLYRDQWLPLVHRGTPTTPAVAASAEWMPLTESGAKRTGDALEKLSSPRGAVFVTLQGADIASYIFLQVAKQLPASTDSVAARVKDETVGVRAIVSTRDLGSSALGAIGMMLGDRQHMQMDGTLQVIGKGTAEFRVTDLIIGRTEVPAALIAQLVKPLVKNRPTGLDENALPVVIPPYIGDIRVAHGRITLYKNVQ
jgi:hypothetical protein